MTPAMRFFSELSMDNVQEIYDCLQEQPLRRNIISVQPPRQHTQRGPSFHPPLTTAPPPCFHSHGTSAT